MHLLHAQQDVGTLPAISTLEQHTLSDRHLQLCMRLEHRLAARIPGSPTLCVCLHRVTGVCVTGRRGATGAAPVPWAGGLRPLARDGGRRGRPASVTQRSVPSTTAAAHASFSACAASAARLARTPAMRAFMRSTRSTA